ncbi:MAG: MerR family transcriptional regulator [Planctomycetota bacterium]|jgi:DNA-binding transcriptional MerR regulator|nr:MerR family transcriptional regulator [Planctomycetota bacterium]
MSDQKGSSWTLAELEEQAEAALSDAYPGQQNRQIREIPNLRTIRYYTTLGIIDRPADWSGRTALYGEKHLLQLVAIKKLQAQGKTLSEIQEEIAGITTRELRDLADIPTKVSSPAKPRRREFWREAPAEVTPGDSSPPALLPSQALQAITLAPGVILLLAAERAPGVRESSDIHKAAQPLLNTLSNLNLIQSNNGGQA